MADSGLRRTCSSRHAQPRVADFRRNAKRASLIILETERLLLREFEAADAAFILRLLNEAAFLRFIGDRGVRTLADAEAYIARGPQQSYQQFGFGLLLVMRKDQRAAIGMCGVMQKPWLENPDLAYAFIPEAGGKGYALEAARAVIHCARTQLKLERVLAVVTPDNDASIRLLEKLGFEVAGSRADPLSNAELKLYVNTLSSGHL